MRPGRFDLLLGLLGFGVTLALIAAAASGEVASAGSLAHNERGAPGALSVYPNQYDDDYHGWPVAPVHQQHPLRATFLDPRAGSVYHLGVDISVPDDKPERGAPRERSHRVYAIESGPVSYPIISRGAACGDHYVRVGHFGYGHVDPTGVVANGQQVKAGQMIGWTCIGHWHVHLSEYQIIDGQMVAINPLHPGGKLWPYSDTAAPQIKQVSFWTPATQAWVHANGAASATAAAVALAPNQLSGVVDVRANIDDPQSFRGWAAGPRYGRLYSNLAPYSIDVALMSVEGNTVYAREVYRSDAYLAADVPDLAAPVAIDDHYAAGTVQALPAAACMRLKPKSCTGSFWFHLFGLPSSPASPYWDTRTVSNGRYLLSVTATDEAGNVATKTVPLVIANDAQTSPASSGNG